MLSDVVANIICGEYRKITEDQPRGQPNTKGLKMEFRLEGYRNHYLSLELLVHGDTNYVGVYYRYVTHPRVEGVEGTTTDWVVECYHDSVWRTGVRNVVWQRRDLMAVLGGFGHWYEEVEVDGDLHDELVEARRLKYSA